MVKMLAYGSLRQGDYNFDRVRKAFGTSSIKKLGETTVPGFKMFNLGFYPGITQSQPQDSIVCDILEVSEDAFKFIDQMERGAGYDAIPVEYNGEELKIYSYLNDLSHMPAINSGDWFNR